MLQTELIRVPSYGFYFFTQIFIFPQLVQSFFFFFLHVPVLKVKLIESKFYKQTLTSFKVLL